MPASRSTALPRSTSRRRRAEGKLQHVAREVLASGEPREPCVDVGRVDHQALRVASRVERHLLEELLHHRVEPACADVLGALVHGEGDLGEPPYAVGRVLERHAFGGEQRLVLALLSTEGVALEYTADGVRRLAEIAFSVNERTENIGARRLYTVMEKLLEEVSFDSGRNTQRLVIDAAYVDARLAGLAGSEDLARYVL